MKHFKPFGFLSIILGILFLPLAIIFALVKERS